MAYYVANVWVLCVLLRLSEKMYSSFYKIFSPIAIIYKIQNIYIFLLNYFIYKRLFFEISHISFMKIVIINQETN